MGQCVFFKGEVPHSGTWMKTEMGEFDPLMRAHLNIYQNDGVVGTMQVVDQII